MRFVYAIAVGLLAIAVPAAAAHAAVNYDFSISTSYHFGGCSTDGAWCASPDTGFLTVTNLGGSTFSGTMGLTGTGFAGPNVDVDNSVTLGPGGSRTFASGFEGSNVGGWNSGLGLDFIRNGTVTQGLNSQAVNLSIFDSQIHSGVTRTSPCDGIATDAFVLQGGSPNGCDNGDGFETSQANGSASFVQTSATPEPGSLGLLAMGFVGLPGMVRRWRERHA